MKNNFTMYAQKVNGAIHVNLSGRLDASRAVEVLSFLHVYARGKSPIVVKSSGLSPDSSTSLDLLQKGLQGLANLGHPVRWVEGTELNEKAEDSGACRW